MMPGDWVGNCPSTIRARATRDPIRSSIDIFLNYTDYRCGNQSANTKYSQPVNLAPLKNRAADGSDHFLAVGRWREVGFTVLLWS
jgi:hypothetical protein